MQNTTADNPALKLAVAIADTGAPPSAFVVWRGFEESMAKAARFGYQGVELALRRADDVHPDRLEQLLGEHRLEVSAISTGQLYGTDGLCLIHPDVDIRSAAHSALADLIRLAARFGRKVNIGRARGQAAGVGGAEPALQMLIDALRHLADIAAPLGVQLIIEPVNRYEVDLIHTLDEAADLLRAIDSPAVGMMADVFHMNIEDARIGRSIESAAPWLSYVHLADSNRLAPGWGHLDFGEVFQSLGKTGYRGWVTAEILPKPDPDAAARQAADFLRPIINDYNARWGGA